MLHGYGVSREQTRTDRLRQVVKYLGWRPAKALEREEFLLARAMEYDPPSLLFRLGCEYLRSAKVFRSGVITLLEKVGTARQAAGRETHARVAHLLTAERGCGLDGKQAGRGIPSDGRPVPRREAGRPLTCAFTILA
ncbi:MULTISPECIES: DUF4158 domain-containing protein [Streptomyces]|uniref:DUF4158 domain-containing protein n=1 Tax=Streptomyces ehimensis TaxID=68195 RepID=A0ABV9BQW3_9ACTN